MKGGELYCVSGSCNFDWVGFSQYNTVSIPGKSVKKELSKVSSEHWVSGYHILWYSFLITHKHFGLTYFTSILTKYIVFLTYGTNWNRLF